MKKTVLFVLMALMAGVTVSARTPLTPELVVPGGYYNYNYDQPVFPEKDGKELIEGTVTCSLTKDEIYMNLTTYIALNNHTVVFDKNDRLIFSVEQNVGKELVNTPVSRFERSQSTISFRIIVDYKDSVYTYMIVDIRVNERLLKVDPRYVLLSPEKHKEHLNIVGVDLTGFNIITKGTVNEVHKQRLAALIAERDGYVNLIIAERKSLGRVRSRDIENIQKMDGKIKREIDLYTLEYESVMSFINETNKRVAG
jgi:hypothetical protein